MKTTEEVLKEFSKDHPGAKCPWCGAEDEGNLYYEDHPEVDCNRCGVRWLEVYEPAGIVVVDEPLRKPCPKHGWEHVDDDTGKCHECDPRACLEVD